MNRILLAVIMLMTNAVFAQREINNRKTDRHQQIPGTRFFLIPPDGFAASTAFQGYREPETGSSLMVMEMPVPFLESAKAFTVEGLKPQGIDLRNREEIKINGQQGLFIIADQINGSSPILKYMLVFGDAGATYVVNGVLPRTVNLHRNSIIASILSVVYDPSLVVDPMAGVPFTIDITGLKLRLAQNMSGTLMYTPDGKIPPETPDKTTVMIGASMEESQIPDWRGASLDRLYALPYKNIKTDPGKIKSVVIDGMSGYEIVAEGTNPGTGLQEFVYQVMLFNESGYYIFLGITNLDFDNNLTLFRKLAASFRRK